MNIIRRCLRHRLLRLWEVPGALLLLLSVHSLRTAWDFANIQRESDALYGPATPEAQQRIHAWQQLLLQLRNADEQTQLRAVNQFFNEKIHYTENVDVWHNVDYWATPIESLRKGEADCEDYAIAKYSTLRQLGVSEDKLRITYVKALRLNRVHMMPTWYATPGAIPLVPSSLTSTISPATQHMDLLPIYSFNSTGLWFLGNQNNKRVGGSKRLSRWQQVFAKIREEGFPMDRQESSVSLFKQLLLAIFLSTMVVFSDNFIATLESSRNQSNNQLLSHAQDAAAVLGASLTPNVNDPAMVELMVSSISDSGYYKKIRIVGLANGKIILERSTVATIPNVPGWFVDLVDATPQIGEATIMRGWQQTARVEVTSDSIFAVQRLWDNTLGNLL